MAQVTFTIAAIDKTRAAFASINQGLRNITTGGDAATRKFLSMGLRAAGVGSIIALLGSQVRRVAQDIESVPGLDRETIDSWHQLKGAVSAAQDGLGQMVAFGGHAIASLGRLIEFGWTAALKGVDEAQKQVLAGERAIAELNRQGDIDKRIAAIERLGKARRDLAAVGESDADSILRQRKEADLLDQKARAMSNEVEQMNAQAQALDVRTAAERDYHKLLAETNKLTMEAGIANGKMLSAPLPLKERIIGLQDAWAATVAQLAEYSDLTNPKQLEKRNEALAQQKVIADQLTKAYEEQNQVAREAGRVIAGSFEDAVFAGEGLRGTIRGIGQDLLRYVFQRMITNRLGDFLTGGISSILGFKKNAMGGAVSAGVPSIVGENGAELFVPSQAGRIIPNHAFGSAGAGGTTIFNIDARGADRTGLAQLEAAIRAIDGSIEERSVSAVFDRMARGGLGVGRA